MLNYFINLTFKKVTVGKLSSGGRNNLGRVCVFGRGGGNKKLYRYIDFYRRVNAFGVVYKILYDPNRTAKICFILYHNGAAACSLKVEGLKRKSGIYSGSNDVSHITKIMTGFSLPLRYIGSFNVVSNVESKPFNGGSISRAAGSSCFFFGKDALKGVLKMRSG